MIKKLFLDKELEKHYLSDSIDNSLDNLNQLNILIGANNTGKSRFLRTLFTDRDFKLELSDFDTVGISTVFNSILDELEVSLGNIGYEDVSGQNISGLKLTLKKHIEKLKQVGLKDLNQVATDVITFWSWFKNFQVRGASHKPHIISTGGLDRPMKVITSVLEKYQNVLNQLIPETYNYTTERLYIPILRGLRPTQFHDDNKFDEIQDNYLKRTIRDYFKETQIKDEEIFTGLRLYNDTKKMLLGKREERDKIKNFESFLSKTFFNNQPFTLIPNIEDDSLHVSIGQEEWPIYKLGDGIQSIIILLYPLFFNQEKNLMVFIEEPENSMHPGLQRLFLETIMQSNFKNFQYFITTHSNHFLDFTIDLSKISVYTFNKCKNESGENNLYKIENTSNENTNILDLIGVRNSSVFLSNCTIWVEGITDRLYIKKYLEIYQKYLHETEGKTQFREDFNFSFIEYGGSNITHWAFGDETMWEKIKANRISSKMFLISDKDSTDTKPNSEKANRLQLLKEVLGEHFQIIEGREIENILALPILIKSIKTLEKNNSANVVYDENKLSKSNYLNKPLGRLIVSSFENLNRKYEADSGTIFCKLDFCRAALSNLKNIDDLSPEARKLTELIFKFIESANLK